jgi:hypothetical protein
MWAFVRSEQSAERVVCGFQAAATDCGAIGRKLDRHIRAERTRRRDVRFRRRLGELRRWAAVA